MDEHVLVPQEQSLLFKLWWTKLVWLLFKGSFHQFSSVAQSCPTPCNPVNHSTSSLPVHHQLPEFTQTHVHWVGDAIQPSHPLSSPSPPSLSLSKHLLVFPVVMYGCENWTIKKAECRRIDAFKLWCWRRLLRVPCKEIQPVHPKGNQSWVFIGRTDVEAETPIFLATWCEELTHLKRPWCWERLRAGGEGDNRGWDGWMASQTQWRWIWVNSGSWWLTGRPGVLRFMGSQRVGHD